MHTTPDNPAAQRQPRKQRHQCLLGLLAAGLFLLPVALQAQEADAMRQLQKLIRVYRALNDYYVDSVEMAPIVEQAITGMLDGLDPHSAYLGAERMKSVTASFDGSFSGIGIEFHVLRDTVIVVNTIAGGPAERAGMRPNDRIVRIDTLDAVGMRPSDVPDHLRGRNGSKVSVDVVRHGVSELLHFVLVRDRIPLNTVDAAYMAAPGIAYIRVNRFGRTTMTEFREAFHRLGTPDKLILDLRGNGGGLFEQAIELAGLFLPRGALIVSTEGRALPVRSYRAERDGEYLDGKLAVLLDESSASASEIVAGAVQDWDRGVIIGRPSFGKGLVQRQIALGDGSAIRLTVARYHTPSGRVIQRPYRRGEQREYYLDHLRRYDDRTRDSLDAAAPEYRTLRTRRPVRGNGGIHPDVLVPNDTTEYSDYHAELIRRGVVNEYVTAMMDRQRDSLTRCYPDFAGFDTDFEVGDRLLDGVTRLASERGIAFDPQGFDVSEKLLRLQLKALVAQRLYGLEAFYRIMNGAREGAFRRAVDLLDRWDEAGAPLLEMGK